MEEVKSRKHLRTEAGLVDCSLNAVADFFADAGNTFFCCEVGVGSCIADIAGLVVQRQSLPNIDKPFTITECIVLAHLRNHGSTRIDLLEKRCGLECGSLRTGALQRLESLGAIRFGAGGQIGLRSRSIRYSIIAVEAKLQRWRDALRQATGYTLYADHSFVLLPREYSEAAIESKDVFRNANVGLLVFDEVHGLHCHLNAPRIRNHGWRRDFIYSSLVSHSHSREWYL